jgi:sugar/nucleoside kinase (ribokinase family)
VPAVEPVPATPPRDGGRRGVVCVGSIIADLCKVIDTYPPLDHLATIEEVTISTGGPGLNMAVNLALLGADFPLWMEGAVGDDQHGAFVRAECDRLGVDTDGVASIAATPTSFTDAMVERDGGRRTFFHHQGANAGFDAATVDLTRYGARILHAGAPGLHRLMDAPLPGGGNGWSALLARARAAGMHTNLEMVDLDPARLRTLVEPCFRHLDSVVINEIEAGALTGVEAAAPDPAGPVDWDAMETMARRLLDRGVRELAVVHFPAGCVAATRDGRTWRQGSVRVPREDVRSTTGAGDAFAAGVIFGLHEAWPIERCLRLGVAAAAAGIRSPHTSAGIRSAATCLADADTAGYRPTGSAG